MHSFGSGCCPHCPVRTTLWANPFGGLHWNLFSHGLSYGLSVYLLLKLGIHYNSDSPPCISEVLPYLSLGYECESSGDCSETYIFWNESIYILPDMVFHGGCDSLLSSADQLFKHGKLSNLNFQGIYNPDILDPLYNINHRDDAKDVRNA